MNTHGSARYKGVVAAATALALGGGLGLFAGQVGTASANGTPTEATAPVHAKLPPPGQFVHKVDNRYFPLKPGTKWVYRGSGSEAGERVVVRVLHRTKQIEGITATVVRDVVTEHGGLIEDTFDWYAQDRRGNVWYLGEATKAYEDGTLSTEGSWEAGVDGAEAGIQMWARPRVGRPYYQEFYAGHAEDVGEVLKRSVHVVAHTREYDHARLTLDTTALEPDVTELKFYAPGVGTVLGLDVSPEQGRTELVRMVAP